MQALANALEASPLWLLGPLFFLLFWLAAFAGRWLRNRSAPRDGAGGSEPGFIISASLGLLALLLGFTVSMAVSRYDGRRTATLNEANAISTVVYRADLMPPALRATTLAELERYLDARLTVGRMGEDSESVARAHAETAKAAARMWTHIISVGPSVPDTAVRLLVVESVNGMFDAAMVRDAALANRLPPTLVLLLILFPIFSLILIGYVSGRMVGAHFMASTELILLLTLVLMLIADLNRPRSGTIATPLTPLLEVQDQLRAAKAVSTASQHP
ncbi:hypothetical protein L6Q21_17100 [Sandaracinobacter sp. RS1-74]|uniref:bestrophin-like domain n=1 Tax=Sandaracinobacteroides sayramensis TaxID=2913411 RepID=UPI001EDB3795|nr:hypothetical protein [Sandaracinobacteroides sayramensis]MCG2842695.1 hypothetical protein [Sandaracinobacteroides sayramensis]